MDNFGKKSNNYLPRDAKGKFLPRKRKRGMDENFVKNITNKKRRIRNQNKRLAKMNEVESQLETGVESVRTFECRACLQILSEECVLYNIFEGWMPPWEGMENSIAEDLAKIANVQISESDIHSKVICEPCCQLLLSACNFIAIVRRNDEILKQRCGEDTKELNSSNDRVWPKPIHLDTSIASSMYENIEIKQEVLSDDEQCPTANGSYNPSTEPNLDIIKIEPEEIIQQQPLQIHVAVNGSQELEHFNTKESHMTNGTVDSEEVMSHLRNPRLFRIMKAMDAKKDSSCSEEPKHISMEELDYNYTRDTNPIAEEICSSPSLLPEEQTQSVSHTTEEDVHPCPSSRARTDSTSSESSSSSSTSSTSSSSSSASESGKDFPPDETDCDPDYTPPAPPSRVSFSPTPINCTPEQLIEENNLGLPEENQIFNNLNLPETDPRPISTNLGLPGPEQNQISNKRKRKGHKNLSVRQNAQKLRNSGQQYTSVSKLKKVIPQKQMGPPCGEKCRLKCSEIIKQEDRENIFDNYWKMGDLSRQRDFISNCIDVIKPKYQYKVHYSNRGPKHSFSFEIDNIKRRVCKIFFKNTLNINNRPIATVIAKKNQLGIVEEERRGKHGKQKKVRSDIIQGIKNHIDSIPRIESHYLRQQTTREYIDGVKNLTDIYNDYETKCLNEGVEAAKIHTFRKVFNEEYNISFFIPKKDQCEH